MLRHAVLKSISLLLLLLSVLFAGPSCSNRTPQPTDPSASSSREFVDEAGRKVSIPKTVERIVSLAPNLTEIIYAIGAGDRLVGNTTFCDYPAEARTVQKVGDTLHPSIERILALKPQVVFISTASQLEAFTKQLNDQQISVYVTNPHNLDEIFDSMTKLAELMGTNDRANQVVSELRQRANRIQETTKQVKPITVFYQVSGEPLYTIGREAYLTDLIRRAGGISVTADVPNAFPRYSDEAALASRPEAIILPTGGSMGSANSTIAPALRNSPAALNNRIIKINDDYLARPGPRLVNGLEEMARALHPESFKP